eukprot:1285994-Pyramimonas_sp.AAC.1
MTHTYSALFRGRCTLLSVDRAVEADVGRIVDLAVDDVRPVVGAQGMGKIVWRRVFIHVFAA